MKILIAYPPVQKNSKFPLLSQNRQFKYSKSYEVRIYPVVMASLATMLFNNHYELLYLDGINERMTFDEFDTRVKDFKPDFFVLETKAPIIKEHWNYINKLKRETNTKIILVGDHVSFFPEESFEHCSVDYCVTGGDYDFTVFELIKSIAENKEKPSGVYWKNGNSEKADFYDLARLPRINRELTKWQIYGEAYLYHPVAYIMSGRGCGGANESPVKTNKYDSSMPGKCTFCIWQYAFWKCGARLRTVEDVVDEIKELVNKYHVKEVFDDNESGFIWNRDYLEKFYELMLKEKLIGKVRISANARADSLNDDVCRLLKKIGFRLLKIGLESGNDKTLKLLKKDEDIQTIVNGVKRAKRYGLVAMLTTMVGYPWETEEDTAKTFEVTKDIMLYKTHFGDSLQSSIIVPYPGTPLYREAIRNNWFIVDPKDYEKFDMEHQILKTSIDTAKWCKKMWRIHLNPLFLLKSFFSLSRFMDIKLAFRGVVSLFGHLKDYE